MRSITKLDLQYAHRFYGFKGEAQYLHGHTGVLTIEVEDTVEPGVNMVFPCNEIQKTAWEVLKNFDHALILREDDPLLPAILKVYEEQGIKDGAPTNKMKGPAFQTELATAYPDCRLVVTKETMTVEVLCFTLESIESMCVLQVQCCNASHKCTPLHLYLRVFAPVCARNYMPFRQSGQTPRKRIS